MPEPYLQKDARLGQNHKWYEYPRLVTVNDLYSFDRSAKVSIEPFLQIVARHFKQPMKGSVGTTPVDAHVALDDSARSTTVEQGFFWKGVV